MKTLFQILLLLTTFISLTGLQKIAAQWTTTGTNIYNSNTGNVGIGTGGAPKASAKLEIESTTGGFLMPRLTLAQRNAVASPAKGLMIYQTDNTPGFYYYNGAGWKAVIQKFQGWLLTGNAATDVNTDFVGTTDAQPLIFRVNNIRAGLIQYNPSVANTSFGYAALNPATTGINNTAIGYNALSLNLSGRYNIAIGDSALYSNTTGYSNTATGSDALSKNTVGYNNTANGEGALYSNTTGTYNTAIGFASLVYNDSGNINTAIGCRALDLNVSGSENTAIGGYTLYNNITGQENTATGTSALSENTEGSYNMANGYYALIFNKTGNNNTASGYEALLYNYKGNNNTANGYEALYYNGRGYSNVAIGSNALFSNSTGNNLVAVGDSALYFNENGIQNTAVGSKAGYTISSASYNSFLGFNAGKSTNGSWNTAVGSEALIANTTGTSNTALGEKAMTSNISGIQNTGTGSGALQNTTASGNAAFGYQAGYSNTSGSNNLFLGTSTNASVNNLTNAAAIGANASVSASNTMVFGNSSVNKWGFGTNATSNIFEFANTSAKLTTGGVWTNASDRKLKNNFQKVEREDILNKISKLDIERWHYIKDSNSITHIGPVAQDFYEAFKVGDDTTISTIDPAGVALLGIQQLAISDAVKDAKISSQDKEIETLKSQLAEMKQMLTSLQQSFNQCNPCASYSSMQSAQSASFSKASLEQNIPNPFNHTTSINYTLPVQYSSAKIMVIDKNGKILKEVNISSNSKGNIKIDASTLASGAYNYSLYVDGRLIDTKQMVSLK